MTFTQIFISCIYCFKLWISRTLENVKFLLYFSVKDKTKQKSGDWAFSTVFVIFFFFPSTCPWMFMCGILASTGVWFMLSFICLGRVSAFDEFGLTYSWASLTILHIFCYCSKSPLSWWKWLCWDGIGQKNSCSFNWQGYFPVPSLDYWNV